MRKFRRPSAGRWRMCVLAAWATFALACSGGGAEVRVGSKAFTESVLLGEIATATLQRARIPATHRAALGGTRLVWNALRSGEIDIYPEYSGTLAEEILGLPGAGEAAATAQLEERLAHDDLQAVGPIGFDDRYGLAMRESRAAALDVRAISDLRRQPELKVGLSHEFLDRRDGWPGLRERYGLPQLNVRGLDHDLAYRGLNAGAVDVIDVYTTDAEIARDSLRVLRDDRQYFRAYRALWLVRGAALRARPEVASALRTLVGAIDEPTMRDLNQRVKVQRNAETDVARAFVSSRSGDTPALASADHSPWWRRVARRLREHVTLVGASLLASTVVAIPLGVWAWRHPRVGALVLGLAGVVQTIPALALLVLVVPLLGLGTAPALAALFFYGLLPIVRNTHAGLASVSPDLREAAAALGLPPWTTLWRIELPLARGTIFAGVRSATIINIGTATLGALVGAGGFGQPILAGVRLADVRLLLEGAVPASVLAVLVELLFSALERALTPPGLRARGRPRAR